MCITGMNNMNKINQWPWDTAVATLAYLPRQLAHAPGHAMGHAHWAVSHDQPIKGTAAYIM